MSKNTDKEKTIKFLIENNDGRITTPIIEDKDNPTREEIELFSINTTIDLIKDLIAKNYGTTKEEREEHKNNELYQKLVVTINGLFDLRLIASIVIDEQDNVIDQVNDILKDTDKD